METLISPSAANPEPAAPKKSNTGLIIGIVVVIVLCCCCIVVAIGAYYISTKVQSTYSSINEALMTPVVPGVPVLPLPTNEAGTPEFPSVPSIPSSAVPQGGLGDDLLRTNTWAFVLIAAAATNCNSPDPATTVIEVTQQPDSAGVWQERWSVTCDGGASKSFDITFTPDPNGGTNISVKSH
jgi:hypothetical protein